LKNLIYKIWYASCLALIISYSNTALSDDKTTEALLVEKYYLQKEISKLKNELQIQYYNLQKQETVGNSSTQTSPEFLKGITEACVTTNVSWDGPNSKIRSKEMYDIQINLKNKIEKLIQPVIESTKLVISECQWPSINEMANIRVSVSVRERSTSIGSISVEVVVNDLARSLHTLKDSKINAYVSRSYSPTVKLTRVEIASKRIVNTYISDFADRFSKLNKY